MLTFVHAVHFQQLQRCHIFYWGRGFGVSQRQRHVQVMIVFNFVMYVVAGCKVCALLSRFELDNRGQFGRC
jgi:hypothetical protein